MCHIWCLSVIISELESQELESPIVYIYVFSYVVLNYITKLSQLLEQHN